MMHTKKAVAPPVTIMMITNMLSQQWKMGKVS